MQRHPPTSAAVGVDQLRDRRRQPAMVERRLDERALPDAIVLAPPVLNAAAAATGKFRTEGDDTRRARRNDLLGNATISSTRYPDHLSRQDIRHVGRLALDHALAVTAHIANRHC